MSSLKNIREKFGISQQDAADWLGISRSLVALYESGIRSLPTKALLQLAKLEMMVIAFDKERRLSHELPSASSEAESSMEAGIHAQQALQFDKTYRLHQQLSFLKNRHYVLQQQMLLIKKLIDNCDEHTNEKEKLWMQMLYHGICCKLTKFDESKQLPLQSKILVMQLKQEFMNKKAG